MVMRLNSPIRVLLIEDSEDDYVFTRDLLADVQAPQFELKWASTYETALAGIAQQDYDVCLLDYHLGSHNGLDILRQAVQVGHQAPIILLTGTADRAVDLEAMQLGATDFLYKDEISTGLLERSLRYAIRQKQAEEAARQLAEEAARRQQQYHALVNSIDGIVWEAAACLRQFSFISQSAERLLGYPIARWLTEPDFWQAHLHPDDQAHTLRFFQELTQASPNQELEFRMITADGRIVWLRNMLSTVVENDQLVKLRGVMVDITQQKQAAEDLQESEARYRAVVEQSIDCIYLVDVETRQILEANSAAQHLLGYPLEEFQQRSMYEIFASDRAVLDSQIQGVLAGESHYLGESQHRCKDGSYVDISTSLSLISYRGRKVFCLIARDITEQKRTETALQQQADRERLIREITQHIRKFLDLEAVLNATVSEVRQLLQVDRVVIYRFLPDRSGEIVVESASAEALSILGYKVHEPCLDDIREELCQTGRISAIDDTATAQLHPCHAALLAELQIRANLVVPIVQAGDLWGLLIAHHCSAPRQWQPAEITLLNQISSQVAIAIQQSEFYHQVQELNANLEQKVQERTAQLQLAYNFEATLKRITDKVRDSLDEHQILQTAVQELAIAIGIPCCNASLYDLEQATSTVCYEYTDSVAAYRGRVIQMDNAPTVYQQLLQGQAFQFCSLVPNPQRRQGVMLACPMLDDQGVLGDLWLVTYWDYTFREAEIRLVQQVANQCAIALRQSRLYQAAQAQVEELERLNRLKDDFLSTVSHELRTPMSNIKLASHMLEAVLKPTGVLNQKTSSAWRYFQILQDECQREIHLINDLLDLARLDAGTEPLVVSQISLQNWLPQVAEPFLARIRSQQQQLQIDLSIELPPLMTDCSSLERVLVELLHNACKYTPPGETIALSAQVVPVWERRQEQLRQHIQIWVSNSGVEIPDQEHDRIFDKFYRIPNSDPWKHGGTGLGLALVKKRIERLNGTIKVKTTPGKTHFILQFPLQS